MSSPLRRVARRLKRIVVGRTSSWQAAMADRFQVGEGSRVSRELIVVRDARGCRIEIGDGSNIQGRVVLERRNARIQIGARTHIGGGTLLDAAESIVIGDDVLLSFDVLVMDHDSHALAFADRKDDVAMWMRGEKNWDLVPRAGVQIGNKAWIGARAIILKGVTIGEGAVVGAGTIVTRSVPAWSVVAGNPGRIIRQLDPS